MNDHNRYQQELPHERLQREISFQRTEKTKYGRVARVRHRDRNAAAKARVPWGHK